MPYITILSTWQSLPIYASIYWRHIERNIMATLNISLPDEMRDWIDSQISSGRYANASDYIRDLIRSNHTSTDLIRLALIEGEQSGESKATIKDIIQSEKTNNNEL